MTTNGGMGDVTPNDKHDDAEDESPVNVTLNDGDSVSFTADGNTNIIVNVQPPERRTGALSSCLSGCGCLIVVLLIVSWAGSNLN